MQPAPHSPWVLWSSVPACAVLMGCSAPVPGCDSWSWRHLHPPACCQPSLGASRLRLLPFAAVLRQSAPMATESAGKEGTSGSLVPQFPPWAVEGKRGEWCCSHLLCALASEGGVQDPRGSVLVLEATGSRQLLTAWPQVPGSAVPQAVLGLSPSGSGGVKGWRQVSPGRSLQAHSPRSLSLLLEFSPAGGFSSSIPAKHLCAG